MSAPLAGKFQDHYALLGVDPRASSEVIELAYAALAEKYNPKNPETGDAEKFDSLNAALEVLSDPLLRREFDKIKGVDQDDGVPKFSGLGFFDALGHETVLRVALLCILYDRRRTKPFTPSLSLRQIENTLYTSEDELNFALWYLKQRGLAGQDDKSSIVITVEGMDFLELNRPTAESIMPFIKPAALAKSKAQAPLPAEVRKPAAAPEVAPQPEAPAVVESVQNIMRRARARG